jgi:hypothetical protein
VAGAFCQQHVLEHLEVEARIADHAHDPVELVDDLLPRRDRVDRGDEGREGRRRRSGSGGTVMKNVGMLRSI